MTWDNGVIPQFSAPQKPSQTPENVPQAIRNRWSRCNHWFNPIKTNRYNTLNVNQIRHEQNQHNTASS